MGSISMVGGLSSISTGGSLFLNSGGSSTSYGGNLNIYTRGNTNLKTTAAFGPTGEAYIINKVSRLNRIPSAVVTGRARKNTGSIEVLAGNSKAKGRGGRTAFSSGKATSVSGGIHVSSARDLISADSGGISMITSNSILSSGNLKLFSGSNKGTTTGQTVFKIGSSGKQGGNVMISSKPTAKKVVR